MNAQILREWLYWFDARMAGRKVALLIDSFSAHESGLDIVRRVVYKMLKSFIFLSTLQASASPWIKASSPRGKPITVVAGCNI
jgi:hypothetical protein